MKTIPFSLLLTILLLANKIQAQNMAINATGALPDSSAMLDIASTTHGFLAPRMTTTQQNAIVLPATGLLIFNNTTNVFMVNTGTPALPVWTPLGGSSSSGNWLLTGNAGTNAGTNFLGTTDGMPLIIKQNSTQVARFDDSSFAIGAGASVTNVGLNSTALGYNTIVTKSNEVILGDMTNTNLSVGIGSENFSTTNREKLLVDMGVTNSVNAIAGKGNNDNYLRLSIQNKSAGVNSSSDVVATANNGDESSNYIDMGINGENYSGGIMGNANDGYLYTLGNNLLIGTANPTKSLIFMTGGTYQPADERMRIDGDGNVGIGTRILNSTFSVEGSHTVSIREGDGDYTVKSTDYVIINFDLTTSTFPNGGPTWTFPDPSTCKGRVYRLVNHGVSDVTIVPAIFTDRGSSISNLRNDSKNNCLDIISTGDVYVALTNF